MPVAESARSIKAAGQTGRRVVLRISRDSSGEIGLESWKMGGFRDDTIKEAKSLLLDAGLVASSNHACRANTNALPWRSCPTRSM
jgi:hypothetical protein